MGSNGALWLVSSLSVKKCDPKLTVHAESNTRNVPRSKYGYRYIWLSLRKHFRKGERTLGNRQTQSKTRAGSSHLSRLSGHNALAVHLSKYSWEWWRKFQKLLHVCNLKWSWGPTQLLQFLTFVQLLFCFLIPRPCGCTSLQMCSLLFPTCTNTYMCNEVFLIILFWNDYWWMIYYLFSSR